MNDMPGWGPDPRSPVPPPPAPPPSTPPSYGAAPTVPQPAQHPGPSAGPPAYGNVAAPYGAPPYAMDAATPPGRGQQVAGLVLGIVSLFVILSWIAFVCGILGIIFGAVGRSRASKVGAPTGMGTAGIVCGSIGVVLFVALIVFAVLYVSSYSSVFCC